MTIMKEIKFKPIEANQIEIKITDTKYKGHCVLLPYIDSRSAADILNETIGVYNWEIKYKDVAGQIYGALSIYDEDRNIWVTKEDTGDESNIAEKKGQASDILKRCMARWGCDWLYHTPRMRISCPDSYYLNDKLTMSFTVQRIAFDINTKECTDLVVVDKFGKVVFDYNSNNTEPMTEEQKFFKIDNKELLIKFCRDTKPTLKTEQMVGELEKFYKFYSPKMAEWKKDFNPSKLWENWCNRIKN